MAAISPSDLSHLIEAAKRAGLSPSQLKLRNPFELEGSVALQMQEALRQVAPAVAERLAQDAGVALSLGAEAALAGLIEWDDATTAELQERRPETYQRLRAEAAEAAYAATPLAAFEARRAESERIAELHGWDAQRLLALGHSEAAMLAAHHGR